jgi:hypothetical protein
MLVRGMTGAAMLADLRTVPGMDFARERERRDGTAHWPMTEERLITTSVSQESSHP